MKVKDGFILRQVAGSFVVLPLAQSSADFNGMLTLNESGVILWRLLAEGSSFEALVLALTEEYEVSEDIARRDVEKFVAKIAEAGCLECDT